MKSPMWLEKKKNIFVMFSKAPLPSVLSSKTMTLTRKFSPFLDHEQYGLFDKNSDSHKKLGIYAE